VERRQLDILFQVLDTVAHSDALENGLNAVGTAAVTPIGPVDMGGPSLVIEVERHHPKKGHEHPLEFGEITLVPGGFRVDSRRIYSPGSLGVAASYTSQILVQLRVRERLALSRTPADEICCWSSRDKPPALGTDLCSV
jgi:hypothetical protein